MLRKSKHVLVIFFLFILFINVFIISSLSKTDITLSDGSKFSLDVDFPVDQYTDYIIRQRDSSYIFDIYTFNYDPECPPMLGYRANGSVGFYYTNPHFTHNYYILNSKGLELRDKIVGDGNINISYEHVEFPPDVFSSLKIYSSCPLINPLDDTILNPKFNAPNFITSKEELASGNFDTLKIDAGDLDLASDKITFTIYKGVPISENSYDYRSYKSFLLNSDSNYAYFSDLNVYYYIPQSQLGIDLSNDKNYMFELKKYASDEVYSSVSFTVGGLTEGEEIKNAQDVTNDKLDEQTNAIKEQTETNKNIFEKIGEMLSYINPFSENFFVYKLLELLGDMLKALFVPSEDFLSKWFTEISEYFSDAFGILYYPIDLVIQVLGRFSSISEQDPIISFGNLSMFGGVIIPAFSYNFNSLLTNNVFKTLHDFYLIVIDVILWFGLLIYCKNVVANIFGGKFTDDVVDDAQDQDYAKYSRYRSNVKRYNEEHGGKKS